VDGERWQEMQNCRRWSSAILLPIGSGRRASDWQNWVRRSGRSVIVASARQHGTLTRTINGLDHEAVLAAILTGVASQGLVARIVKVYRTSDCAAIGHTGAQLSSSGIAIGLQSRGTTVIHKRGLARLSNLELFPQSPSPTLETYQAIVSAGCYALSDYSAVPVQVDNWARRTHCQNYFVTVTKQNGYDLPPMEMRFDWEPDL
jgi:hypothetical protein